MSFLDPFLTREHPVTRKRITHDGTDELGNPATVEHLDTVNVKAWWIARSAEPLTAGHEVYTCDLCVIAAPGLFNARDEIRINNTWYQVTGEPLNFDHGPFNFAPGLELVTCNTAT